MKKIKVLVTALIIVAAGAFLLTTDNLFKADVSEEAVIEQGVYIGGVDVSGMNAAEATDAVNEYLEEIKTQSITLVGPKGDLKLSLEKMGVSAQTNAAVEEAVAVGKYGNLIKRFKEIKALEEENRVIEMGLSIDKEKTADILNNNTSKIDIKAVNHGLKITNGEFVYIPGQQGDEVDIVTSVNALNEHVGTQWELAAVEADEFVLTSIVSNLLKGTSKGS